MSKTGNAPWDKKVTTPRGEMLAIESPDDPRLFEPKLILTDQDGDVKDESLALTVTILRGAAKEYKIRLKEKSPYPKALDPFAESYDGPGERDFMFVDYDGMTLYMEYLATGSKRILKKLNEYLKGVK
jgi:hypothetical protein